MAVLRVPYRFFSGIDDRTSNQLFRNFEAIQKAFAALTSSTTDFDCYVDPTLAADDTANRKFKSVATAINTMYTAGFHGVLKIGCVPNSTNVLAVDTAAIVSWPSSCWLEAVKAFPPGADNTASTYFTWDINTQVHPRPTTLYTSGITVQTSNSSVWASPSGGTWYAADCHVLKTAAGNLSLGISGAFLSAWRTRFEGQVSCTGTAFLHECTFYLVGPVSWGDTDGTHELVLDSCSFGCVGSQVFNITSEQAWILNPHFNKQGLAGGNTVVFTDASTSGADITATGVGSELINEPFRFSFVGKSGGDYYLSGKWWDVTTAAPAAGYCHSIYGQVEHQLDATGPANIQVVANAQGGTATPVTLRGTGVSGTLTIFIAANAAVGLSGIGLIQSALYTSYLFNGAPAGTKSFNLDAASTKTILDAAGDTVVGAGTDLGVANLIRRT